MVGVDAEPTDVTTGLVHPARHPKVWIRLNGAWQPGEATEWFRTRSGAWAVTVRTAEVVRPYVYDERTVRPREPGESAPDATPGGA